MFDSSRPRFIPRPPHGHHSEAPEPESLDPPASEIDAAIGRLVTHFGGGTLVGSDDPDHCSAA